MNHRDPELSGGQRRCRMDHLPVQADLAAVGGVNAGQDLAHGALACTVLAHERMATPCLDFEAHRVKRLNAWKPFADAIERD